MTKSSPGIVKSVTVNVQADQSEVGEDVGTE